MWGEKMNNFVFLQHLKKYYDFLKTTAIIQLVFSNHNSYTLWTECGLIFVSKCLINTNK